MTKTDTIACLSLITATYPNLTLTEATVDVWAELLHDLPTDTVRDAVMHVLRQQKGAWWPTPGAIRTMVRNMLAPQWPTPDRAWHQVTQAVRRYGYMQPQVALASLEPPVARVAQALGWQEICASENIGVLRGQFLKLYEFLRDADASDAATLGFALPQAESRSAVAENETPRVVDLATWSQQFGLRKEGE